MNYVQSVLGSYVNEDIVLFFYDRDSRMPISIEGIGISHANSKYFIQRECSDVFVLEYVVSGKGYIETGGRRYTVGAGDVYCLEPGSRHKYYSDRDEPFEKIWVNFFSDLYVDVFRSFGLSGRTVFHAPDCRALFDELLDLRNISNYSDDICYDVCAVLFRIVCSLAGRAQMRDNHASELALATKKALDGALYASTTVEQIAEELHFSKAQVIREFQKYYATTPYNYLLGIKIEMAKKLLRHSDLSVQEVSDKLAFSEPHYFSRIFKKKTGRSPSEFKNRPQA